MKPGSIHHFLHLKMSVPCQEYDSCCPFVFCDLHELWFQTGNIACTQDLLRYLPVHDTCKSIGFATCNMVPAAHDVT